MEVWKDVVDYDGHYKVSNLGRVKNKYGLILKHCVNKCGYSQVRLSNHSKQKSHLVHRLVAIHYINNYQNKYSVNHIDGNKYNNKIDNLEWATMKENVEHAYIIGTRNNGVKIELTDKLNGTILLFRSQNKANTFMGFSRGYLTTCFKNKKEENKLWKWRKVKCV